MNFKRPHTSAGGPQRGIASLFTVFIMSMLLLAMASGLTAMSRYQTRDRNRYEIYKDEFAACEQALNKVFAHIQFLVNNGEPNLPTAISNTPQPVAPGFTVTHYQMTQLFAGNEAVTEGQWKGLTLYRLRYKLDVKVEETGSQSSVTHEGVAMSQNFEISYIPLFNFAIFYHPTMEIAPGPNMSVTGRVHANGDMYIQADNSLKFYDRVTCAGGILHGRHPDSGKSNSNGTVTFTDTDPSAPSEVSMGVSGDANGDGWLDSRDGNWTSAANNRWNEYVQDSSHGVSPLGLPIPQSIDSPHHIIERADPTGDVSTEREKLENKAGLRIIRDEDTGVIAGYDESGNDVDLEYYVDSEGDAHPGEDPSGVYPTKSIIAQSSFYDAREATTVNSIDLNMANLLEYTQAVPANGIIYISNETVSGKMGVARIVNGAQLPTPPNVNGLSVASDDPMYIRGDYNTVNKTLSMVAGDAVSILSNGWNDADGNNWSARDLNSSDASTVNAVVINGIVPSADSNYSGGVENYFRFLENWSGVNFTFSGSIVQLWESETATGEWSYGSPVYNAPGRPWSWDQALGGVDGPPGTPRVVEIRRTQWQMTASDS